MLSDVLDDVSCLASLSKGQTVLQNFQITCIRSHLELAMAKLIWYRIRGQLGIYAKSEAISALKMLPRRKEIGPLLF